MTRPIVATVSQQALQHNLAVVRQVAPHSRIWSVVKANAYGHGLLRSWQALATTDGFALLNIEEAILLRESGWKGPVLLLEGFFHLADIPLLDHYQLTTCVHSDWQINALAHATVSAPLSVYVKVNTGMNRLGFRPERLNLVWQQLSALKTVGEMTLMTHFAMADHPNGVDEPLQRLEKAAVGISSPRSLANSATLLWHPKAQCDWVRPGIILYGASPNGHWPDIAETTLKPVMTLKSELIGIQQLSAREGVGYGQRYLAQQGQRIGIVAGGYADGYPRHASTGTPILVDGARTRIVGTVSMDMIAVDLTPCPQANIGSPVELWGEQIKIDDVAEAADTVGYELMCALAPRVPVSVI